MCVGHIHGQRAEPDLMRGHQHPVLSSPTKPTPAGGHIPAATSHHNTRVPTRTLQAVRTPHSVLRSGLRTFNIRQKPMLHYCVYIVLYMINM